MEKKVKHRLTGCNFTCRNESCDNLNTYLSIHFPWTIAKIDKVIDYVAAQESDLSKPLLDGLKKRKEDGREHALIPVDAKDIEPDGYRFQLFCRDCFTIWEYDQVRVKLDGIEDELAKLKKEKKCDRCGNQELSTPEEMMEDPVSCPKCKEPLVPQAWIVQPSEDEESKEQG